MIEFEKFIKNNKEIISKTKAKEYNSLVFAFVGDSLHTLFVRTHLAGISTAMAGKLHTLTNGYVKAN